MRVAGTSAAPVVSACPVSRSARLRPRSRSRVPAQRDAAAITAACSPSSARNVSPARFTARSNSLRFDILPPGLRVATIARPYP
jgi:hypothetical protein